MLISKCFPFHLHFISTGVIERLQSGKDCRTDKQLCKHRSRSLVMCALCKNTWGRGVVVCLCVSGASVILTWAAKYVTVKKFSRSMTISVFLLLFSYAWVVFHLKFEHISRKLCTSKFVFYWVIYWNSVAVFGSSKKMQYGAYFCSNSYSTVSLSETNV